MNQWPRSPSFRPYAESETLSSCGSLRVSSYESFSRMPCNKRTPAAANTPARRLVAAVGVCPLCPQKRTFVSALSMSALCHKRTSSVRWMQWRAALLTHGCRLPPRPGLTWHCRSACACFGLRGQRVATSSGSRGSSRRRLRVRPPSRRRDKARCFARRGTWSR